MLCTVLRGGPAPWSTLHGVVPPEGLLERARHHGVQPLLFHALSARADWADWPIAIRRGLEDDSKAAVALDMLRAHRLSGLFAKFSEHGIRCLLMKGAALAMTHYATAGTRTRSDTDLLISPDEIRAAQQAIRDAGFSIVSPVFKSHQFTAISAGEKSGAVRVDVHWRVSNNPRFARALSFDESFARASPIAGVQHVRMLNVMDALIVACVHRVGGQNHDPDRLIWLFDIHLIVSSMSPSQMAEFAQESVARGLQRASLGGLLTARRCFGTIIPDSVIQILGQAEEPDSWPKRLRESPFGLLLSDWKILPDVMSRVELLRELFLPPGSYLLQKYQKGSRLWLPILYVRQAVTGMASRLLLR